MKLAAFDLEVADRIPFDALDWRAHAPFGITVAAIWDDEAEAGGQPGVFYGDRGDGGHAPRMSVEECDALFFALRDYARKGTKVVGYNSLSFDFFILATEVTPSLAPEVARLAFGLDHVDVLFEFLSRKGFMVKLAKVAEAMGLEGKLDGMSGAAAPALWDTDPAKVVDYCVQDARLQYDVARAVQREGAMSWVTQKGATRTVKVPELTPTIWADCRRPPNVSWMDNPPSRDSCTAWARSLIDAP